jgi:hypothetical protein
MYGQASIPNESQAVNPFHAWLEIFRRTSEDPKYSHEIFLTGATPTSDYEPSKLGQPQSADSTFRASNGQA